MTFKWTYIYMPIYSLETDEIIGYEVMIMPEQSINSTLFFGKCLQVGCLHEIERALFFDSVQEFFEGKNTKKLFISTYPYSGLTAEELTKLVSFSPQVRGQLSLMISEFPLLNTDDWHKKRAVMKANEIELVYAASLKDEDEFMTTANILQPDVIKIENIGISADLEGIVTRIRNTYKVPIILGGIECPENLHKALASGADYGQGLLLGKPVRSEIREEKDIWQKNHVITV